MKDGRFEHGVYKAAVLPNARQQFLRIFNVATESGHGGADMLAVVEDLNAVPGVRWRVRGHEDGTLIFRSLKGLQTFVGSKSVFVWSNPGIASAL